MSLSNAQTTCSLLGASRHLYGHQNTAHRKWTRLKRRHCAIPVYNFVARHTRLANSLYAALSKEADVMVAKLTGHASANVDILYKQKLGVLMICAHFLTNDPWCGYTVFQGWPHNTYIISLGVTHGRILRTMPFSMNFSNPLIPYSHESGWISVSAMRNIAER